MKDDVAIIIPAYNPSKELYNLIEDLMKSQYTKIVIINDGSENTKIFEELAEKVKIITHKSNKGKGIAIKTGIEYCYDSYKNIIGIITVDADGQHRIEDINKVYNKFYLEKNAIILGSRNFKAKNIPLKSKIGNKIFRYILNLKTKVKIKDTQTGLRAIPFCHLEQLTNIKGERFEYETNVILYAIKMNIKISEVDIQGVYINKNKSTNYRAIRDSIKIMLQL